MILLVTQEIFLDFLSEIWYNSTQERSNDMLMVANLDLKCDNADYPCGSSETPKALVAFQFGQDCVMLKSSSTEACSGDGSFDNIADYREHAKKAGWLLCAGNRAYCPSCRKLILESEVK